jgi:hypothetical protein
MSVEGIAKFFGEKASCLLGLSQRLTFGETRTPDPAVM